MPTGYTAAVEDGTVTELNQFAMLCARAFGVAITMRDDSMSKPIPMKFEYDTKYYDGRIADAKREMENLNSLTDEECASRAAAEHILAINSHKQRLIDMGTKRQRYDVMVKKVIGWKPPQKLDKLKEFMLSQLKDSINFDCYDIDKNSPEALTPEAWRAERLSEAARTMKYATEERAKEIQRVDERNEYLRLLRESLK